MDDIKEFIEQQIKEIQQTLDAIPAQINHLNGAKHALEIVLEKIEKGDSSECNQSENS